MHLQTSLLQCFWRNLLWKARKVDYCSLNAVSVGKDWICVGSWWYSTVGVQVEPSLTEYRLRKRQIFKSPDLLFFCYLCRYGCVQCVYCLCDRSSYGNLQWKARVWNLILRHNRLHCVLYHCDVMPRLCTKGLFVLLSKVKMPEDLIEEGHCINFYLFPSWLVRFFSDVIEFLAIAKW